MVTFELGQPVPRTEDPRLLTGGGHYTDDFNLPHQAYAVVLRSPHAHAEIRGIDKTAAEPMPGEEDCRLAFIESQTISPMSLAKMRQRYVRLKRCQ